MRENRTTTDALTIMYQRYYQGKPERIAALQQARINDEVARKIILLREKGGFSQSELAELVGVGSSVICELEDADYEGLSRYAKGLPNKKVSKNLRVERASRPLDLVGGRDAHPTFVHNLFLGNP